MESDNIGDWDKESLSRFILEVIRNNPTDKGLSLTADNIQVAKKVTISDQIQFLRKQLTVGAAGGASALPATPTGYILIMDSAGTNRVIPYYTAS